MGEVVCAWCGAYKGELDGEGTSHGICDPCLERVLAEIEAMNDEECAAEIAKEKAA